jgi:serine/threonine protein kinase
MAKSSNWTTASESKFPWERDALDFVREQFPGRDPYRAWANFEFIADDGSVNEVDLLVFTPQGFFLVEIKSRPGRLFGDAGTWTWETDGHFSTVDNPLILANLKAKKLRALLQKQKVFKKKGQPPYIEALVFCSAPDLKCDLQGNSRHRVCLRDREAVGDKKARAGILAAIMRRECSGLDSYAKGTHDRPMAKVISQAMDQAGIRPSQRMRKVMDYQLDQLIDEGPGYQDWIASHSQVAESKRRVRLYLVRTEATPEDRATIQRAALREFQILETLEHPGILRAFNFTEHELGPALLFEHDTLCMRLDHYLAQRKDKLSIETQLDLIRQIGEVVRYAHEKKVIHRGLCPQSILVSNLDGERPRIKVFNWQVGYRQGTTSTGVSRAVSATSHVDRLVDDVATAYMAPEALTEDNTGEHLDVFSLGTIAWHIFAGSAPAANAVELSERLRGSNGLKISSVVNGVSEWLEELIRCATNPIVPDRMDCVAKFLSDLDDVENELTEPEHDTIDDPSRAQIGDVLPGGYTVVRRLGQGGCSVALLVERDDQDFVLKVANDPNQNDRVADEADVLSKEEMRHPCIVDYVDSLELGQYRGFLMRPVYAEKEKRIIETLGQRLRREGRLHIDLLQRFGEDLLSVVNHLEEQGIPHKDIKPDNIAVGMVGRGSKLHLVLFDFSLSRTAAENIRAGTTGYLDPLLPLRKPARWDLHAERYSAAMTLYELASGTLAKWGDGVTQPDQLSPNTEITIDAELFDLGLREPLLEFFTKAFRRNIADRFDNAEEMLRAWRIAFERIDAESDHSDHGDETAQREALSSASLETPVIELRLGTRAANALDRANISDVAGLLRTSPATLWRLRGVGKKTCREILDCQRVLRDRLGTPPPDLAALVAPPNDDATTEDIDSLSIDLLIRRVLPVATDRKSDRDALTDLLGLEFAVDDLWPGQSDVAVRRETTPVAVHGLLKRAVERWRRDPAITRLRSDLVGLIDAAAGVCEIGELPDALLAIRGSSQEEPLRSRQAIAVARAAVEVERVCADPRLVVRRVQQKVFVATSRAMINVALKLGKLADRMADADPLVPPPRVLETLRGEAERARVTISDNRVLRLAAAAADRAALSGKYELYPRQMDELRALKLSLGGLYGVRELTVEQIKRRVSSRYPLALPIPDRPRLDELLKAVGFEFPWSSAAADGVGGYVCQLPDVLLATTGSQSIDRRTTKRGRGEAGEVTPEEADARQFEERLSRSLSEGSFLALLVHPKYYDRAREELCRRFPLQLVDFEGMFLDSLQATAAGAKVKWDLVLQTDTKPKHGDWDKLMMLVGRAMPKIEEELVTGHLSLVTGHLGDTNDKGPMTNDQPRRTMLMIYPGLLARYDQMNLLSRLSQKVGRDDGIPGLWLLLPGEKDALIDGKPVPLMGPGQRTRIPESWLQNLHRSNQSSVVSNQSEDVIRAELP